jgi:hypothetical protein
MASYLDSKPFTTVFYYLFRFYYHGTNIYVFFCLKMPLLILINELLQCFKSLALLQAIKYKQKVEFYILLKAGANI